MDLEWTYYNIDTNYRYRAGDVRWDQADKDFIDEWAHAFGCAFDSCDGLDFFEFTGTDSDTRCLHLWSAAGGGGQSTTIVLSVPAGVQQVLFKKGPSTSDYTTINVVDGKITLTNSVGLGAIDKKFYYSYVCIGYFPVDAYRWGNGSTYLTKALNFDTKAESAVGFEDGKNYKMDESSLIWKNYRILNNCILADGLSPKDTTTIHQNDYNSKNTTSQYFNFYYDWQYNGMQQSGMVDTSGWNVNRIYFVYSWDSIWETNTNNNQLDWRWLQSATTPYFNISTPIIVERSNNSKTTWTKYQYVDNSWESTTVSSTTNSVLSDKLLMVQDVSCTSDNDSASPYNVTGTITFHNAPCVNTDLIRGLTDFTNQSLVVGPAGKKLLFITPGVVASASGGGVTQVWAGFVLQNGNHRTLSDNIVDSNYYVFGSTGSAGSFGGAPAIFRRYILNNTNSAQPPANNTHSLWYTIYTTSIIAQLSCPSITYNGGIGDGSTYNYSGNYYISLRCFDRGPSDSDRRLGNSLLKFISNNSVVYSGFYPIAQTTSSSWQTINLPSISNLLLLNQGISCWWYPGHTWDGSNNDRFWGLFYVYGQPAQTKIHYMFSVKLINQN